MASKRQTLLRIIRQYREEMGVEEVHMPDVAQYAAERGYPLPRPKTPIELFAKQLSKVASEEVRYDATTGKPYHAYRAIMRTVGNEQLAFWFDLDRVERKVFHKYSTQRREHFTGELYYHVLDVEHWQAIHPQEEQIPFPLDFTDDVEYRRHGEDEGNKKAS